MYWFITLIPILTLVILLIWFRSKIVWWEMITLCAGTILLSLIIYWIDSSTQTRDTIYKSSIVQTAYYDEEWSEWITKRCSRSCGKDNKETCYYDCSYEEVHRAEWIIETTDGSRIQVSNQFFQHLIHKWNSKPKFVELNRDYCCNNDGDRFQIWWDKADSTIEPITQSFAYDNKLVGHNQYNAKFKNISIEDKVRFGIYEYPSVVDLNQNCILGKGDSTQSKAEQKLRKLNALNDPNRNLHVFVLLFHNKSEEVALMQQDYWQGGNQNEFVICVGLNSINKVNWTHVFSWDQNELDKIAIRDYVNNQPKLNLLNIVKEVERVVVPNYKAKNWHDFDYLENEVSPLFFWMNVFFVVLWNIVVPYFMISNRYTEDNPNGAYRWKGF